MGKAGEKTAPNQLLLRLLATSDVHAHVLAWDYHADRPAPDRGLTRLAQRIARLRLGADICLLVDNGDFLQGSPLGDAVAAGAVTGTGGVHPVIAAMNALRYDAAALGNHEFSHGLGVLLNAAAQAQFPILSANILTGRGATPLADQTLFPPTQMIRHTLPQGTIAVGLIGLTPTQTLEWEAGQIDRPLQARGLVETAAAHAAALREQGADLVVALCHTGVAERPNPQDAAAANAIAALPGIDAVVAGHTHSRFPNPDLPPFDTFDPVKGRIHGKPVVAPGFFGSHLGVIDLILTPNAGQGWTIASHRSRLVAVARRNRAGRMTALVGDDPSLLALSLPAHQATRAWAAQPIGANPALATSHFALVMPTETVRLVARAKVLSVRQALAGGDFAHLPVVAASAPFRAGGRGGPDNYTVLPQGKLTLRHVTDLYPFPNTVAALYVTGAHLTEWLERSASLFYQIQPGAKDACLIDPDFPFFNFDSIEGVTYRFDLSQPARYDAFGEMIRPDSHRLRDLALKGVPLAADQTLVLATNNYRMSGAGGFAKGLESSVLYQGRDSSRDAVQRYITAAGELPAPQPPNWGFVPMPDTSVIFLSAADAVAPRSPQTRIEALDTQANGFRRFRLWLT